MRLEYAALQFPTKNNKRFSHFFQSSKLATAQIVGMGEWNTFNERYVTFLVKKENRKKLKRVLKSFERVFVFSYSSFSTGRSHKPCWIFFAVCGANLVASAKKRVFYSHPTYDKTNYGANMKCTWVFTSRAGTIIQMKFVAMRLEQQRNCKYDHVIIHDGNSTAAPLLDKICGEGGTGSQRRTFTSTGNKMLVRLITDRTRQKKGFKAEFVRLKASGRRRAT